MLLFEGACKKVILRPFSTCLCTCLEGRHIRIFAQPLLTIQAIEDHPKGGRRSQRKEQVQHSFFKRNKCNTTNEKEKKTNNFKGQRHAASSLHLPRVSHNFREFAWLISTGQRTEGLPKATQANQAKLAKVTRSKRSEQGRGVGVFFPYFPCMICAYICIFNELQRGPQRKLFYCADRYCERCQKGDPRVTSVAGICRFSVVFVVFAHYAVGWADFWRAQFVARSASKRPAKWAS